MDESSSSRAAAPASPADASADEPVPPGPAGAVPSALILAAGRGTRMRSARPKVLHEVAGRAMLTQVLETLTGLDPAPAPVAVVLGHRADEVRARAERDLSERLPLRFALQREQRGTGHAALQAREALGATEGAVLILCGDTPLLRPATLARLLRRHAEARPALTLLSARVPEPRGYGRVVRDGAGTLAAIVEEADADEATRAIDEVNAGVYAADGAWLWPALEALAPSAGGEIYLTDLVAAAIREGRGAEAVAVDDPEEILGVNTRAALARAEAVLRARTRARHLAAGVTMIDPERTWIDADVRIGEDTELWPGTYVLGGSVLGRGCRIGPDSELRECRLGDGVRVERSVLRQTEVGSGARIGPFAHLRPGAVLEEGVRVGNFVEIKNSRLGAGVRAGHLAYLGDADVGEGSNIGAGAITCNFDGRAKHETRIGRGAFVGSDAMLVAPLRIGDGARIGAGSVVTRDVPDGATVYGVPAREAPREGGEAT